VELAERIIGTMPSGSGSDTVLFVNSGSEANELAWRTVSQQGRRAVRPGESATGGPDT